MNLNWGEAYEYSLEIYFRTFFESKYPGKNHNCTNKKILIYDPVKLY